MLSKKDFIHINNFSSATLMSKYKLIRKIRKEVNYLTYCIQHG